MTDSSIENLNDEAPGEEKILFGDNDISSTMEDILNEHSYPDETVVNPHSKMFVPTFVYFRLLFRQRNGHIVLFGRAFYLEDVTSTIAIKTRKGRQK